MARILVVDDNEQNRYLQQVLLRGHGHEVVLAANGIEALERARGADMDLVITDILMPDMDGFELCRAWRADEVLRHVPLIFYTATYTDSQDEAFAMSLGAARFLRKPGQPAEVVSVIEEVIASHVDSDAATNDAAESVPGGYLRQYNAALIRKLEAKVEQLEAARNEVGHKLAELQESHRVREELERELRHAQRLEAVGRVASGVAHDFNNLLTAIGGYASLSLHRLARDSPACADMGAILDVTDRAADLTRQLLAFGRQQVLEPRVHTANAIVQGFAGLLQRALGDGIQLAVSPSREPLRIRVDRGQVEQVLMNLAINASDAMDGRGNVSISVSGVTHEAAPYVRVSVADDGDGMDEETRARVFEPFFTTKDKGKGTGLGMSTVYGIVQQSGGHIDLSSEVGRGTEVSVLFPRTDAPVDQIDSDPASSATVQRQGAVVLVVEDDEAVREVARRALQDSKFVVHEASDAAQALAMATQLEHVDVLFTDYVMYGGDGLTLAVEVQRVQPGVRVLLTSGYSMDLAHDADAPAMGVEFIAKPYATDELVRKIRGVLDA